jgi:RecA-family ATPase
MQTGSGASGSTAWNNAVRSRLYLTRPPVDDDETEDHDIRVLKTMKSNYGKIGDTTRLRWKDGVFVVDHPAIPDAVDKIAISNIERTFLDGLRKLADQGRGSSDAKSAANYAPKMVHRLPGFGEISVRKYEKAMLDLQGRSVISRVRIGSDAGRRPLYGLAETCSDLLGGT